ncbi:MAG: hypothetical protein SWX82_23110 [Cyanobacteriota bacterium]|nr:hypothetical protein [Cyanobacteriota bacterium]
MTLLRKRWRSKCGSYIAIFGDGLMFIYLLSNSYCSALPSDRYLWRWLDLNLSIVQ